MTHTNILKAAKRASRYAALSATATISAFILLAEPTPEVQVNIAFFLLAKAAAFFAIVAAAFLLIKWEQEGKLPELSRLMAMGRDEDEEDEEDNNHATPV